MKATAAQIKANLAKVKKEAKKLGLVQNPKALHFFHHPDFPHLINVDLSAVDPEKILYAIVLDVFNKGADAGKKEKLNEIMNAFELTDTIKTVLIQEQENETF